MQQAEMDAMAEAAAQAAQANAGQEPPDRNTHSEDVLGMATWLQQNGKKSSSKPKQESGKRDPNLGTEEDGPQVSTYNPDSDVAEDGQTLSSQSPLTQNDFKLKYGLDASRAWVKEHNQELAQQRTMFGVSRTPDWMKSKPSAASGVPGQTTTGLFTSSTTSSPALTTSGQRVAFTPQPVATYKPPTITQPGQAPTTFDPLNPSATTPTPAATTSAPTSAAPANTPKRNGRTVIKNNRTGKVLNVPDSDVPQWTNSETANRPDGWTVVGPMLDNSTVDTGQTTQKQSYIEDNSPGKTADSSVASLQTGSATPISSPINVNEKPVDMLAQMSVRRQGGDPSATVQESKRILAGIGSLVRGEKEGAWAEPYLNDIARVAWARQARSNGENADPRSAPQEYIEKWKDAFYGSDPDVPLVKELDQQMIDNAVSRTPTGQASFDWKQAFGPNGESGLISRQVTDRDCGTNAFSTLLRARGYNIDPGQAYEFGKKYGYHNGEAFTGPDNLARMLKQETGLDAKSVPLVWKNVDAELDAGRPVALSGPSHYWTASAYRDTENGREYYVGATGAAVGNPVWARADQLHYDGSWPDTLVTASGNVDPNARAVTQLGLRPPGQQTTGRAALTRTQTTPAGATRMSSTQQASNGPLYLSDSSAAQWTPIVQEAASENNTDPYMVAAILEQESGGVANAESSAGAGGLMQLMPGTARSLGVTDNNDPKQNIRGGAKYFRQMLDTFDGDVDMALAAYNAGPGAVMKYGGIPPYEETQRYVREVKERYQRLTSGSRGSVR